MPAVKIPGAESIENVAPQRDPGVTATPDAFGAQIGASEAHFGDTLASLGAHMYKKLQDQTADTWVQTHNIDAAVELTQAQYANRAKFPQGDQDGGTAASDDLRRGLQQAQDRVTARTTARLGAPTADALSRVNATFAGRAQDALVQGVTFGHNQQVIGKQTVLDDNADLLGSRVLSNNMPLNEALKTVDAMAESGKSLYSASDLEIAKEKWQHKVIDSAIKSKYASGDKPGGDAIAAQYYGDVPRSGDSNAARAKAAMDYFQSTGKTKEQAAGIVGNLIHESNLNTTASGDSGTAFGIAQWRGDRQVELRAYARSKGKSPSDFQTQLEFINQELNSSESDAHTRLLGAKTTKDATMAFIDYERPKGVGTASPHGWSNRLGNAQALASGDTNVKLASADGSNMGGTAAGADGEEVSPTKTGSAARADPILPNPEKALYWRTQSKSVGIDLDRQAKLQALADKKASKEAEDGYLQDWFSDTPKTNVQNMMMDNRLSVDDKLKLRSVGERQLGEDPLAKTSAVVTSNLIDRMRLPEGSPDKLSDTKPIFDAYTKDKSLTKGDFKFALEQFSAGAGDDATPLGKRRAAFVNNAGTAIEMANMGSSMQGGAGTFQKYNFEQYVAEAEKNYRAEKKNPDNLYNPLHPDYLGKLDNTGRPAILKPFLKDAQTNAREEAATITPAVVAPTPDSAANRKRLDDWLRNRGGAPFPTASTSPVVPTSE